MLLVKNLNVFIVFFLCKLGLKMWFGDLLDRKQAFLGYKNFHFLNSPHWKFLTHDFGQKLNFFIDCSYAN